MDRRAGKDGDAGEIEHPAGARYPVHRRGTYLDIDGEVDVDYGDGTPEWLADRLRGPEPDAWEPRRSNWDASSGRWRGERQ